MKLYTEKEVRDLLNDLFLLSCSVDDAIDSLIPIEIPNNEQIEERAVNNSAGMFGKSLFEEGAEWMKEQILNQNK